MGVGVRRREREPPKAKPLCGTQCGGFWSSVLVLVASGTAHGWQLTIGGPGDFQGANGMAYRYVDSFSIAAGGGWIIGGWSVGGSAVASWPCVGQLKAHQRMRSLASPYHGFRAARLLAMLSGVLYGVEQAARWN